MGYNSSILLISTAVREKLLCMLNAYADTSLNTQTKRVAGDSLQPSTAFREQPNVD